MGKVDLGMKLTCESCGARFYDLGKQPAICPKCGAQNQRPQVFRSRRPSEEAREKRAAVPVAAVKNPVDEPTAEPNRDAEEEGGVIEDTSELSGDDGVAVVVEKDERT